MKARQIGPDEVTRSSEMRKNPDGQLELILENRQLLAVFFVIVGACGVFFSLGYIVGRNTFSGIKVAQAAAGAPENSNKPSPMPPAAFANEPPAASSAPEPNADQQASTPDLNFYQSVEEKGADAKLTPAEPSTSSAAVANAQRLAASEKPAAPSAVPAQPVAAVSNSAATAMTQSAAAASTPFYTVQVSALTRREDASSLLSLIKGKGLPVQVNEGAGDKLFHVIVGPYESLKDAEAAKAALEKDGFRPIIKK
jgi:DedD protein